MRQHTKWFMGFMSIVLSCSVAIAGFNYWIDPLWLFGHDHRYNQIQYMIDERLQKTNYMTYHPFHYDGLLIGGSRTTYINQHDFQGMTMYNYGVSSFNLAEALPMIRYAKQVRGQDFKTIVLQVDFTDVYSANKGVGIQSVLDEHKNPLYRWKSLFAYDTLQYAIDNFKMSRTHRYPLGVRYYNRQNVVNSIRVLSNEAFSQVSYTKIKSVTERLKAKNVPYLDSYLSILKQIKTDNPHTKFLIFTPPMPAEHSQALLDGSGKANYARWLKETVEVFGEVHHYYYTNSITLNQQNYIDPNHFNPKIGTMIAHQLTGQADPTIPEDFGIVLNKANLDVYLAMLPE